MMGNSPELLTFLSAPAIKYHSSQNILSHFQSDMVNFNIQPPDFVVFWWLVWSSPEWQISVPCVGSQGQVLP